MSKIPEDFVSIPFIQEQQEKVAQGVDPAMPKDIVTLRLYLKNARSYQQATSEVPYLLGNAASIFKLLFKMTAGGFAPEEGELCSLYELCGRGLEAARDKEGEALDQLDVVLRSVLALHPKEEVAE